MAKDLAQLDRDLDRALEADPGKLWAWATSSEPAPDPAERHGVAQGWAEEWDPAERHGVSSGTSQGGEP